MRSILIILFVAISCLFLYTSAAALPTNPSDKIDYESSNSQFNEEFGMYA